MEYIFRGDSLKSIKLTIAGDAGIDQATFNDLKTEFEKKCFEEFERSGSTVTAICSKVGRSSDALSTFYAFPDKESLKAVIEETEGIEDSCQGGGKEPDYSRLGDFINGAIRDVGRVDDEMFRQSQISGESPRTAFYHEIDNVAYIMAEERV